MAFDLNAYETVAERLQRAHADHDDLRIITRIIDIIRDPQTLRPLQYIVEASVFYGDVLKAVDFAEEMVGSSHINKTSALENASTSASGRALSLAGYLGVNPTTKKPERPTRQDMEKASRVEAAEKPTLKTRVFTDSEIGLATAAIAQAEAAVTKDELKEIYRTNADVLEAKVNGVTLLDVINKKAVQFK
jgi:hypothetical protein